MTTQVVLYFQPQSFRRYVFHGGPGVMNRTWSDNHQQPVVFLAQNAFDRFAASDNGAIGCFGHGEILVQSTGRNQWHGVGDVDILGLFHGMPPGLENKKNP
jgi:hypothetical protein